jgi:hypothetical protein
MGGGTDAGPRLPSLPSGQSPSPPTRRTSDVAHGRRSDSCFGATTTSSSSGPGPQEQPPRCCWLGPATTSCCSTGPSCPATRPRPTRWSAAGVVQLSRWGAAG